MAIVFHVVFRFAFHLVHLDFGFHVFSHFFPCSFSFGFWFSFCSHCSFHFLFHVDFGFHFFYCIYMLMSSAFFIFFVYHLFFWFHFFIYMFMLSNMSIFHLVFFRCVCPVHCVLVSHCAVLCLFPVCVYVHSNCFFCKKYPNIFPRHFGWGAKQALLMNKIHAMKRHENPDENLFKWKLILAMKKDIFMKKQCKWKWKNEKKCCFNFPQLEAARFS